MEAVEIREIHCRQERSASLIMNTLRDVVLIHCYFIATLYVFCFI